MNVNTVPTGPALTIGGVKFGNWGNVLDMLGGGNVTISGNLTATSNGEIILLVNGVTRFTLQGSTTGNTSAADGNK